MARRTGGSWSRQSNTPFIVLGTLLTLAAVLVVAILLLPGPGGLASASPSPTAAASASAVTSPAPSAAPSESAGSTPEITPAITPLATAEPSTPAGGSPAPSTKPTVVSLTVSRRASCLGDNGTGQVGMISINWTTTGTTGVRLSIDPPSPATAYGYGYHDYGPTGPAIVPFAGGSLLHDTGGRYHLYVVTTLHTSGYYSYRYQKVYDTRASPAP